MTSTGSTFRTAEPDLTQLLEQVHAGEIHLPLLPARLGLGRQPHPVADRQRVKVVSDRFCHAADEFNLRQNWNARQERLRDPLSLNEVQKYRAQPRTPLS